MAGEAKVAHNVGELEGLQACKSAIASSLPYTVNCKSSSDCVEVASGTKVVHFIRHGEGYHNVAQREWRAKSDWDGISEPYTLDKDTDFKFVDAELTAIGEGQARELQSRTSFLKPELLIVSPMRRATLTGLLAFEEHISKGTLPVVAHELCHERAGKHTCDKRLPKADLSSLYPAVDYGLLQAEDDPYWGDGLTREDLPDLAARSASFIQWLVARPEQHIAVAAHSAFLLSVFNAVLECDADTAKHFATGEMRTVVLSPMSKACREVPGIVNGMPMVTVDGSGPARRDYIILERLTFASVPKSLTVSGQTVDVVDERGGNPNPRYMARGLDLGATADTLVGTISFEDGSCEQLLIKIERVC